jgi:hypothetical protein
MEERSNRNIWIIVAAVLIVACCCALACGTAAAGWLLGLPVWQSTGIQSQGDRSEWIYEVGEAASLKIDNFAGAITVRAGERGQIGIVATKRGPGSTDLGDIRVDISKRDGGLLIRTRKPPHLDNVSVGFDITVPPGTRLDASTGAGSVDVRGLKGEALVHTGAGSVYAQDLVGDADLSSGAGSLVIGSVTGELKASTGSGSVQIDAVDGEVEAQSGSGSMTVRGARGAIRLDTGSGSISYEGQPQGDCRFETGSGSITLRLPGDLDMAVDLGTGSGTVEVEYPVDGKVTKKEVRGTVGDGSQGSIYAHTGTGSVDFLRR